MLFSYVRYGLLGLYFFQICDGHRHSVPSMCTEDHQNNYHYVGGHIQTTFTIWYWKGEGDQKSQSKKPSTWFMDGRKVIRVSQMHILSCQKFEKL